MCSQCASKQAADREETITRLRKNRLTEYQLKAGIPPAYWTARLNDFDMTPPMLRWDKGFRLLGKPRTGKTHFLCAVGNSLLLLGHTVRFVTMPEMMEELRLAARFDKMDCAPKPWSLQQYFSVPYLLLDDLGTGRDTEFSVETLFTIFNHRFNHQRHLSISTNLDPKTLDTRLYGRLLEMTSEVSL